MYFLFKISYHLKNPCSTYKIEVYDYQEIINQPIKNLKYSLIQLNQHLARFTLNQVSIKKI